jgi:hypothetical protein
MTMLRLRGNGVALSESNRSHPPEAAFPHMSSSNDRLANEDANARFGRIVLPYLGDAYSASPTGYRQPQGRRGRRPGGLPSCLSRHFTHHRRQFASLGADCGLQHAPGSAKIVVMPPLWELATSRLPSWSMRSSAM